MRSHFTVAVYYTGQTELPLLKHILSDHFQMYTQLVTC